MCKVAYSPDGPFLGRYPEVLQTDNGREYSNSTFTHWCEENSVKFRHGMPYSPHVNGQVHELIIVPMFPLMPLLIGRAIEQDIAGITFQNCDRERKEVRVVTLSPRYCLYLQYDSTFHDRL